MPRRNRGPRTNLPSERLAVPELGVRHPVVYTKKLDSFFAEMDLALEETIPTSVISDNHANTRYRKQYRIYDDPERIGITVMERRLPRNHAKRHRLKWNAKDAGRIKGQIQNEIDRLDLPSLPLRATLTDVIRVGDADQSEKGRKLGLIVDQSSSVAELLVQEHELVVNGISGSLNRFRYPYSSYVPKLTVSRVFREVEMAKVNEAVLAVGTLLPIEIELESVRFISHQEF